MTGSTPTGQASPTDAPLPSASESRTPDESAPPTASPAATDVVAPEPTPDGSGTTAVTIVNWGAEGGTVHASGLVTGDTAQGGTCTLTATSASGQKLDSSIPAQSTPSAINCGVIEIPVPAGTWSLVLGYRSSGADARSEPVEVSVP